MTPHTGMIGQDPPTATLSYGFPPVCAPDATVLILGSLPGVRSLDERRYYAQPRNAFWKIMGALYDAGPDLIYEERVARLIERGVAVWDVLGAASRPGSLDSAIDKATALPNDFAPFFELNPSIRSIFFNGTKAAELYRRMVLPTLAPPFDSIPRWTLPSTSPAFARMPFDEKLARWSRRIRG